LNQKFGHMVTNKSRCSGDKVVHGLKDRKETSFFLMIKKFIPVAGPFRNSLKVEHGRISDQSAFLLPEQVARRKQP